MTERAGRYKFKWAVMNLYGKDNDNDNYIGNLELSAVSKGDIPFRGYYPVKFKVVDGKVSYDVSECKLDGKAGILEKGLRELDEDILNRKKMEILVRKHLPRSLSFGNNPRCTGNSVLDIKRGRIPGSRRKTSRNIGSAAD